MKSKFAYFIQLTNYNYRIPKHADSYLIYNKNKKNLH